MALRLPRLPKDLALVDKLGRVSVEFQRWWQSAMLAIENVLLDLTETIARVTTTETDIAAIEAVTFTAGNGLTGGGGILTNPAFAVGAGTGIVVNADDVAVSAKLALYHGGDTPSAFTLGIVDSVDAAAWRAAIGAGTSSTTGTVTSVEASGGTTGLSFTGSPITTSGTLTLTGTLAVANGGTGVTSSTGTGSVVLSTSPTLVTPMLGTPASGTLTNCTGLPISTGVAGLGTNVAAFLATPSSANLAAAVTDEDGSGLLPFETTGTWTPTVTAGSGTITTVTATGRYTKIGRMVSCSADIQITTNGTGATSVIFTLPFTVDASTYPGCGRETNSTGNMLQVLASASTTNATIKTYNDLYPGGSGYRLMVCVTYFV